MNKIIRTIFHTAVFAALAVSCQKEIEESEPVPGTRGTLEISIGGLMGEYTQVDATKSELVNTVRVAWEGKESVYVYDGTTCLGSLTANLDGSDDRYAILSGTIDAPAGDKLFLVHSPLLTEAPVIAGGKLSISLAEQATTKAPFVVFASLDYTDGVISDAIVPFSFATSVIRVNCIGLSPNTAISSAEISNVNTSCVLTFADGAVTVSGADAGTITRLNADGFAATKVNAEGDASFQLAVPVLSASASRTLVVSQGGSKHADGNFSKASIAANLSVNTICTMGDMITAESPAGAIGVIDGRKAVVVNLWGTKYAVALSNEGDYCDFDEAAAFFHGTDLNVWRVPTMDEMKALTDLPREYDSTASAIEFKTAGGSVSFPLAGLSSSAEGIAEVGGHGCYYTSTPLEGTEGDIVCIMDKNDGQPYVIYLANATPDKFKMSLRLFYQLTATDPNVIHGLFTVNSEGRQVFFSKGNLYHDGNAFKFEENQYDVQGSWSTSHVSHFFWSPFASVACGSTYDDSDASVDDDFFTNATVGTAKADFTVNGITGKYRTLSTEEWQYLFGTGAERSGKCKHGVTVCGLANCVVLLPDNWQWEDPVGNDWQDGGYSEETLVKWSDMEAAGAVCLPAAGFRDDTDVVKVGEDGYYWASTPDSEMKYHARCVRFLNIVKFPDLGIEAAIGDYRSYGNAVRLVADYQ